MLFNQSVNVHQVTSAEAAAPFAFNRFKPKFCRARLALDVHMQRFSPVIGVKEKAIPALTEHCWHFTSVPGELCNAQVSINSR